MHLHTILYGFNSDLLGEFLSNFPFEHYSVIVVQLFVIINSLTSIELDALHANLIEY